MHTSLIENREALAALCRQYEVVRLDVFGSAARGKDFVPGQSDFDFLVAFAPPKDKDFSHLLDFQDALTRVFETKVDLVERAAIEESRNTVRRDRILREAIRLFGYEPA